jgi:diphthamide synthase (EF-2-diphthine--ammonia ligase)
MIGIKLAYYKKKDWKRFVKIIADRESMHDTWHAWNKDYERTKRDLTNQGFDVVDIVVDLDELMEYCRLKGIKNDGKARSQFVQEK